MNSSCTPSMAAQGEDRGAVLAPDVFAPPERKSAEEVSDAQVAIAQDGHPAHHGGEEPLEEQRAQPHELGHGELRGDPGLAPPTVLSPALMARSPRRTPRPPAAAGPPRARRWRGLDRPGAPPASG